MSNECDKCGLEDPECHCYLYALADRVDNLEDALEKLTDIVQETRDLLKVLNVRYRL